MVKVKMFETPEHKNRPAVDAPITDAKAFNEIVDSRRSVRFYSSDDIPQDVIDSCLDAALKAPNSSNLQTWEIHHVVDPVKKKELVRLCLGQPAASTAKEIFVFVARPDLWKRNNQWMIDEFDRRGDMPEKAYQYFRKDHPDDLFYWLFRGLSSFQVVVLQYSWYSQAHSPRTYGQVGYDGLVPQKHCACLCTLYVGDESAWV